MILFIILAVLSNNQSKIPYHKQLTENERYEAKSYSSNLNNPALPVAEIIADPDQGDKTKSQQSDTERNSRPNYALIVAIAAVVVNAIYVVVAGLQWRAIKYQVRMSHRAQLAAKPSGNPTEEIFSDTPRVHVMVTNVGGTTAYDCRYETWIELLPSPASDFSAGADHVIHPAACALYPNHVGLTINIPIRSGLEPHERQAILDLQRFVCIRVLFTYRDIFRRWRRRYANFGFYLERDGFGFMERYNDSN